MYFYEQEVTVQAQSELIKTFAFQSEENYLGIISAGDVGVDDYMITDILFRIKAEGDNSWIVENRYSNTDIIQSTSVLFGLPVQAESQGKKYIFELEAKCTVDERCIFNPEIPRVTLRHYYPRSYPIRHFSKTLNLAASKIFHNFIRQSLTSNIGIVFGPLVAYLVALIFFSSLLIRIIQWVEKYVISMLRIEDVIVAGAIIIDLLLQSNSAFYLLFICLAVYVWVRSGPAKETLFLCFSGVFYALSLIFQVITLTYVSNRISLWAFVFLLFVVATWVIPAGVQKRMGKLSRKFYFLKK
jgi:hypothetical protein